MAQKFNPAQNDTPGERFLLIQLDLPRGGQHGWSLDRYRHISARVVRRAFPDSIPGTTMSPTRYYDGRSPNGYRWADYSSNKASGLRVSGLKLSGQITVSAPESDSTYQPYCNTISFTGDFSIDHMVQHGATAKALLRHKEKLEEAGMRIADTFEAQAHRLAEALGIKHFLFYKQSLDYGSLEVSEFEVVDNILDMAVKVQSIIAKAHG